MDFEPANVVKELSGNYFNALKARIADYRSKGIDVIDLASGNPDQPTPQPIIDALKAAIDKPENQGYPPFYGKKAHLKPSPSSIKGSMALSLTRSMRSLCSLARALGWSAFLRVC